MVVDFFSQFGAIGLFVLAFIEAIFFPVPPDALLIPLTLLHPAQWILFAIITIIGSVTGAGFGYWLGKKGGRPFLRKLFREGRIQRVEQYYQRHGDLAVFIAGFSPIPYKVFAISSGVFQHHFWRFLLYSTISRAIRFFGIAYLTFQFGASARSFIEGQLGLISLGVALALILTYGGWRWHNTSE